MQPHRAYLQASRRCMHTSTVTRPRWCGRLPGLIFTKLVDVAEPLDGRVWLWWEEGFPMWVCWLGHPGLPTRPLQRQEKHVLSYYK
jgi:uncharacterized membrane protein